MREHRDDEAVDFAIVGAGAGGATLAYQLAAQGVLRRLLRRRAVLAAARGLRVRRDRAAEALLDRRPHHRRRGPASRSAATTAGEAVGGSTVHFSMISLRWRPEWFKSRSAARLRPRLADQLRGDRALLCARPSGRSASPGRCAIPGGRKRAAYPVPAAPGQRARRCSWRRGADELGHQVGGNAARHRVRAAGKSPPCVYRGFCNFGCSTNAKQSALVVWAHQAVKAGAEIRDMAMVGRIETDRDGAASPGCTTTARARGDSRRRATSSSPAMPSRRRACSSTPPRAAPPGRPRRIRRVSSART